MRNKRFPGSGSVRVLFAFCVTAVFVLCLPLSLSAAAQGGISEPVLYSGADAVSRLESEGFQVVYQNLNRENGKENHVYLGCRSGADGSDAVTGLLVSEEYQELLRLDGISWLPVSDLNLNAGESGDPLYLYYTVDPEAGAPVYLEDEGGAVYKDSEGMTLFRDCIFTGNRTEESGAAIYINDEGCYLVDTSITGNTAEEYGAVYVDAYHSVDVSGLTVVRYNTGDDETSNVYIGSHGYLFGAASYIGTVYDGGLYEGSRIGLSYDGNAGEEAVILNISEYQKQFFFADSADHPLSWEADESRTVTELLISSAIGEGNAGLVLLLALILIAGGVTGYFIKNRGKGGKRN